MPDAEKTLLAGKSLLVVVDDTALGRRMCDHLKVRGATVIGPAPTVHYARLVVGKRRLDGAILDVRRIGREVYEFADMLTERGVPILFATANREPGIGTPSMETSNGQASFESLIGKVAAMRPIEARPQEPAVPPAPKRPQPSLSMQERFACVIARSLRRL